eukprot:TRINITY_DN5232_c0_g1_i1.p1 TRINITY_DN5232_c0_g1~~TRINITY_DN5232_c0_g1_i1.p1  ORF type:complete len:103 (+),score=26.88 TRINITY_DN5232_c0_g1_i1:42-311(+)
MSPADDVLKAPEVLGAPCMPAPTPQGVSAADGSTNYCNIHNLYANESKDNVKPVNTDLTYKEKKKPPSSVQWTRKRKRAIRRVPRRRPC